MRLMTKDVVERLRSTEALLWHELLEGQKHELNPSQPFKAGYYQALVDFKTCMLKGLIAGEDYE